MKFARATPQWVRDEYQELLSSELPDGPGWREHVDVVMTQGLPVKVWKQLTPRDDYCPKHPSEYFLYRFTTYLNGAVRQFDGEFRMTKAERIKSAEKLSRLSDELAATLRDLKRMHSRGLLPMAFRDHFLRPVSDAVADEFLARRGVTFPESVHIDDSSDSSESETGYVVDQGDVADAVEHAYLNMELALDEFGKAARLWRNQGQAVAKPNDANAARLHFLRTITFFFMRQFGRPQREATIAVTQLFFDCSEIDEALLSRLAPVK